MKDKFGKKNWCRKTRKDNNAIIYSREELRQLNKDGGRNNEDEANKLCGFFFGSNVVLKIKHFLFHIIWKMCKTS